MYNRMKSRIIAILSVLLFHVGVIAQNESTTIIKTPHISAREDAFAKTVLMPGDPLRAKFIAEKYLEDVELVTSVRNMLGYTGTYKGVPVSVMGSGMGIPSMGIYSWELFKFFGVENIIRIGSAGSYQSWLDVMDITLAECAVSESTYARSQGGVTDNKLFPSGELNEIILQKANELGINLKTSTVFTTEAFYTDPSQGSWQDIAERMGADCVEMESFALFHNANMQHKRAATLMTISDSFVSGKALSPEDRETVFTDMMRLALETAVSLSATDNIKSTRTEDPRKTFSKYIENGQVVIYTEGQPYSITGVPAR